MPTSIGAGLHVLHACMLHPHDNHTTRAGTYLCLCVCYATCASRILRVEDDQSRTISCAEISARTHPRKND